jgi:hypothetical protein
MATVKTFHRLNPAQVAFIAKSPAGPFAKDLLKRGVRVQSRARRNLGGGTGSGPRRIDNGLLRASIAVQLGTRRGELAVRIGSGQYYALWVHEGTGIYGPRGRKITPRTAPYLVFRWKKMGNKLMVVKSVKGMPGNPYLKAALPFADGRKSG